MTGLLSVKKVGLCKKRSKIKDIYKTYVYGTIQHYGFMNACIQN